MIGSFPGPRPDRSHDQSNARTPAAAAKPSKTSATPSDQFRRTNSLAVMWLSDAIGRRPTYFLSLCVAALAITWMTFQNGSTVSGICYLRTDLSLHHGRRIRYFCNLCAKLFPTRVRVTGQGFSYNMLAICWRLCRRCVSVGTFGSIPSAVCAVRPRCLSSG